MRFLVWLFGHKTTERPEREPFSDLLDQTSLYGGLDTLQGEPPCTENS